MAGTADGFVFAFTAVVLKIGFHRLLSCGVRLGQVVNHPDAPITAGADDAGGIQIHRGDFVASDGHPHRVGRTDKDKHPKTQKSFHTFREEMFSRKYGWQKTSGDKRTRKKPRIERGVLLVRLSKCLVKRCLAESLKNLGYRN